MRFRINCKQKASYSVKLRYVLSEIGNIEPVVVISAYLLKASEITILRDGHEAHALTLMRNGNVLKYIPEYDRIADKGRVIIRYKYEHGGMSNAWTNIAWTNIAMSDLGPTISRDVIKQLRKYSK